MRPYRVAAADGGRSAVAQCAALAVLLSGCGAADRALLSLPVTVRGLAAEAAPAEGVSVRLTAFSVTISDLQLESPVSEARPAPARDGSELRDRPGLSPGLPLPLALLPAAAAHPGHDFAGNIAGELTGTWALDLLSGDTLLGEAACYEGAYATGRFTLPPDNPAILAGIATVDGTDVDFRFELPLDQEVTGIPMPGTLDAASPAAISLTVDAAHALASADWRTPDSDGDGGLTAADGLLGNTLTFGLVSTPTWNLSLEK